MSGEIWAALAIAAGFGALLGLAEFARRRGATPETSRKIVHIGGGLVSLAIPSLFTSPVVVLLLGALCSAALWVGQRTRKLRAVHGVSRTTAGSEYYPLAVALLFVVSEGRSWLFVPSLLVLAIADAFAALIGARFGKHRYIVEEESKSVEGSLAFLALALPAILLPLRLLTDLPWAVAALSALLVAALVTGFEAVSLRGADNLFVPIGVCVILAKITAQPPAEIVYQTASLTAILLAGGWLARRTRSFEVGGALTVLLFGYGVWALAPERWAAAALIGFAGYAVARRWIPARPEWERPLRVRIVFRAVSVPLVALVAANMNRRIPYFTGAYAAALAAATAQSLWNHAVQTVPAGRSRRVAFTLFCAATAALTAVIPLGAQGAEWGRAVALLIAPASAATANAVCAKYRGRPPEVWGAFQLGVTLGLALAYGTFFPLFFAP